MSSAEMSSALRESLAEMAEDHSFKELVAELDHHHGRLSGDDYDVLWLFCWALDRGKAGRYGSSIWDARPARGLVPIEA